MVKVKYRRIKFIWWLAFIVMACVERIDFDVPPAQFQIIVEGMITDSPGPYTVTVTKGLNVNIDSIVVAPITNAHLTLFDDEGNSEPLTEKEPGIYITGGLIQGEVGHEYHIRVETSDGRIFESAPDKLNPVGEIDNVHFEYEKRSVIKSFGEIPADVFNIYVDANAGSANENYVRWRYTGTYKVVTYPAEHYTWNPPYLPYRNPFPCSGYIITGGAPGGLLVPVGECECCTCWAKHYEPSPQLSDVQLVSGGEFKNVKVGEVPISNNTFLEKYMVEVEQMSLSRNAFEFFKLIRAQKEGASSLFQPPSGEIRGNITPVNNNDPVVGLFWATSLRKKTTFILPTDIPYLLTPFEYITYPCYNAFDNASTTKPENWE
jgi:hypothetical protein